MTEEIPIFRSPRLLTGSEAAAITKLLRTKVDFSLRIAANKKSVDYVFSIPIPSEFRKLYPAVWNLLLGHGLKRWKTELAHAYWQLHLGKKKKSKKAVSRYISDHLLLAYHHGLEGYLKDSYSGLRYAQSGDAELSNFRRMGKIKKSQPTVALSFWVVRKLEALLPQIKSVRRELRDGRDQSDEVVAQAIRKIAPGVRPDDLFSELRDSQDLSDYQLFVKSTPSAIAEAFVRCQARNSGRKLRDFQIKTFRRTTQTVKEPLLTIPPAHEPPK